MTAELESKVKRHYAKQRLTRSMLDSPCSSVFQMSHGTNKNLLSAKYFHLVCNMQLNIHVLHLLEMFMCITIIEEKLFKSNIIEKYVVYYRNIFCMALQHFFGTAI